MALAQVTLRDLGAVRDVTVGAGSASSAPDWTDDFVAVWTMENTGTEPNQATTACGTDCDLDEASDPLPRSGTVYVEGSYSRELIAVDTTNFTCPSTECEEILGDIVGDYSVVMWVRYDDLVGDEAAMDGASGTPDGYYIRRNAGTPDKFDFLFGNGSVNYQCDVDPTAAMAVDTWYHIAIAHDDSVGQVCYVKNGAAGNASDTSSWALNIAASTVSDFQIPDASNRMDGFVDETGIYAGILSDNAIDRICACGIKGDACTHNGSIWTDDGRNDSDCGGALGVSVCLTAATPGDCT